MDGNNRKIVAFSGIGDNESFFQTLENYRFNLIKKISFPRTIIAAHGLTTTHLKLQKKQKQKIYELPLA